MISAALLYGGAWLRVTAERETLAETISEGGWSYAVLSADSEPIDEAVLAAAERGLTGDFDLVGGSLEQAGFA